MKHEGVAGRIKRSLGPREVYITLCPVSQILVGQKFTQSALIDREVRKHQIPAESDIVFDLEKDGAAWRIRITEVQGEALVLWDTRHGLSIGPEPEEKEMVEMVTEVETQVVYAPAFPPPDGLFPCVPLRDGKFKIPDGIAELLRTLMNLSKSGQNTSVRFTGPAGTGKTSLCREIAAKLGWNFIKIDVGGIREAADWFSHTVAENGSTRAVPSLFVNAIQQECTVLLLDEVNRVDPRVMNSVFGLLDEIGWAWSDDLGCRITRAPHVLILATMNCEDTNVGVFEQDSALMDRFPFEVRLELPPMEILSRIIQSRTGCSLVIAKTIATISDVIQADAGPGKTLTHGTGLRPLIAAAYLAESGLPLLVACMTTIAPQFDRRDGKASQQASVIKIIKGVLGPCL
jgi:hypothetical protein